MAARVVLPGQAPELQAEVVTRRVPIPGGGNPRARAEAPGSIVAEKD